MLWWCGALQVTGTLLKGYKARFKGAPISSTFNYLKQYVSVSIVTILFETFLGACSCPGCWLVHDQPAVCWQAQECRTTRNIMPLGHLLCLQGVLPHNPLVTHETDTRHLRDPAFLRGALRYRVARMLFTLQLRLRR